MAEEAKAKGNAAFSAGNFTDAIRHFTDAINLAPMNHVFYSNRSAAFANLNQYSEALSDAQVTVSLKPDWFKGYSRLGTAHHGLHQYEDAISAYKKGLELDPDNDTLKSGLAIAQSAQSEQADETEPMNVSEEREIKERKAQAQMEKEAGNAAYIKKDFETAIAHYTKAFDLDGSISFLTNRAAVYLEIGKACVGGSGIISLFLIGLHPSCSVVYHLTACLSALMLTLICVEQKQREEFTSFCYLQYDECIKDCETAVERGRELRSAYKMVARALTVKGTALVKMAKTSNDLEPAIETFQKALSEHHNPDTLKKLNDAERAKIELEQHEYFNPELGNECFKEPKFPDDVKHYTGMFQRNPKDAKIGGHYEWTEDCERYFIEIMAERVNRDSYGSPIFKGSDWNEMDAQIFSKFSLRYGPDKLKGKYHRLRIVHAKFTELINHPGVAWDALSGKVFADDDAVWDDLFKRDKIFRTFKKKGCKLYPLLTTVFGSSPNSRIFNNTSTNAPQTSEEEQSGSKKRKSERDMDSPQNMRRTEENFGEDKYEALMDLWIQSLIARKEKYLAKAEKYKAKSSEVSNLMVEEFSIRDCMSVLEATPGVSSASYNRALHYFTELDWRKIFLLMSADRRKAWLDSLPK